MNNDQIKPGYKTTEFWLSAIAMLISILYGSGFIDPDGGTAASKAVALVAGAMAAMGYTISRTISKK